jgi:hypothetical protein
VYEDLQQFEFGEEHVAGIYLCSIHKKQSDGFYNIEASLEFHDKLE